MLTSGTWIQIAVNILAHLASPVQHAIIQVGAVNWVSQLRNQFSMRQRRLHPTGYLWRIQI